MLQKVDLVSTLSNIKICCALREYGHKQSQVAMQHLLRDKKRLIHKDSEKSTSSIENAKLVYKNKKLLFEKID